jgi:AP-3 complex subunit mu
MIDCGFPITTELTMLSDLVKPPPGVEKKTVVGNKTSFTVDSGLNWRKTGIKYSTNKILFDVVEEYNCVIDVY